MKRSLIALLLVGMPILALAQHELPTKNVFDADIVAGQMVNWVNDTIYILQEIVYAESGAVVNIEAGTQIKGIDGPPGLCGALTICRGARIYAIGTPDEPIIFTAEIDSVPDPADIPLRVAGSGENVNRGLWGGLMILGRACTNSFSPDTVFSEGQIEGVPLAETRARYGGGASCDDDDTSGVLMYVSIRHGGNIFALDNEINGLTMGALGRGTIIENVEVFQNFDDGFEWFGGAVNTRNLISAFNTDDMFDTDEGWRGKNQFWFAIQDSQLNVGNSGTERDGGTTPEDSLPLATHTQWNSTYIGSGMTSVNTNNNPAINIRDNNVSSEINAIFTDFRRTGLSIGDESGEDSRGHFEAGDNDIEHNLWFDFGDTSSVLAKRVFPQAFIRGILWDTLLDAPNATDNRIVDPLLLGISRDPDGGLDPRPAPGSPAFTGAGTPADTYFTNAGHLGAFGPEVCDNIWVGPWTALFQYGYLDTSFTNPWNTAAGDVNGTPPISLPDVIHLVNYVFDKDRPATSCLGSSPGNCWTPDPVCRGEINGTAPVSLPDVIHLVNYVFDKDRPAASCLGSSSVNCWPPVATCPCLKKVS